MESKVGAGSLQQPNVSSSAQLIENVRSSMLSLSDEDMKQIQATHAPDGREVDIKPLLYIVDDILNRATPNLDALITTGTQAHTESLEERTHQDSLLAIPDALSYTMDRISVEISYKALSDTDAHQKTLSVFNMISHYAWDDKLVLTLAAFALHYGEFWLLAQIYSTNQLAKDMTTLRHITLVNDLIRAILEVTRCLVGFRELPSNYITPEVRTLSTAVVANIPTILFWTIRSIVTCATHITSFTSMGFEFVTATKAHWDDQLSTLPHKLKNIRDYLKKQLDMCYQYIEGKREDESFQMLVDLFKITHIDNKRVLKALIYSRDDRLQPLVDGYNRPRTRVYMDVLWRKKVLLLISGLDISQEELAILEHIYMESRMHSTRLESPYELVWIPLVDRSVQWSNPLEKQFETVQSRMPWYTVHHPSLIGKPVVRFIKEKWHFRNKPILVVLDPQGKVVSPNAIHMMCIWGSIAFPFTSLREEQLWRDEIWRLELLVDGIDQTILNWIKEGKYIFLYGGDDTEWVRKFTNSAREVARAARIPIEMFYVGKSSNKEQVQRVIATIVEEKLSSSYLQDPAIMIWFFWTRIESMLFSKIQLGKADGHVDLVMQEIKRLLSYDREGGWALLSKGSSIVVNGHGNTVWTTLLEYEIWKENVVLQGFDVAFKNHHDLRHGEKYPPAAASSSRTMPEGFQSA